MCSWCLVERLLELSDVDFPLHFCLEAIDGEAEEDCSVCQSCAGVFSPSVHVHRFVVSLSRLCRRIFHCHCLFVRRVDLEERSNALVG